MRLTKAALKGLPKVIGEEADNQMEYVQSVLKGMEKRDALKLHFPDLYQLAIDRANGNDRMINANITSQIGTLERKNTVKKMYEVAHKGAWTNFVAKKFKLYENLNDMAVDDENSVRDRISATKVLLDHMPKFEEDKTIEIVVKDNANEFVENLRKMQVELEKQSKVAVIDVEVEDG